MKKVMLLGALALFGAMNAQTFGLKAGGNLASISNLEGAKSKFGFYGGVFMNAPLAENFSIQPEVLYNGKGAKAEEGDGTYNVDYISVPVMFQYNATPEFYIEAGPEFSFLMSAKAKSGDDSLDLKDYMNSFDFGVGLGIGYNFTSNFGANARYVAGFTDTFKDNEGDDTYKNGVFQLGLTYKFAK